jgi:hypothetical protein
MRLIPRLILLAALTLCAAAAATARGADSVEVFERARAPRTQTRLYQFDLAPGQEGFAWSTVVNLRSGIVEFTLTDPGGDVITKFSGRQLFTGPTARSGAKAPPGSYRLEVTATDAVGRWQAQVAPLPPRSNVRLQAAGAAGMILVALAAVAWWRRFVRARGSGRAGGAWRWFWIGVGLWVGGVAIKIVIALLANQKVLEFLDVMLPYPAFVLAGGLYVGVISAICEIALIAILARFWRGMTADADRAVAIGVGAGAFEAALLGVVGAAGAMVALMNLGDTSGMARAAMAMMTVATPLAWLVAPIERALTIPCHVSARTMTLLGVARRRWTPLVAGFALFAAIDSVAGVAHVSGRLGMFSLWWLELAVLPFALMSIPLIARCVRTWPVPNDGAVGGGGGADAATAADQSPAASVAGSPVSRESAAAFAPTTPPSPIASPGR